MNHLIKHAYEKMLFVLALTAAGLGLAWAWQQNGEIRKMSSESVAPVLSGSLHAAQNWLSPQAERAGWSNPTTQSRGEGWCYEIFTPPAIFHRASEGHFSLAPRRAVVEPAAATAGLELLAVRPEPYRLQFQGYCGERGDYLGMFVSPQLPETLLARSGGSFPALGLTLKSIDVRKVRIDGGGWGPVCHEAAAFAVVQEDNSGTEVVLDSRTRRLTDRWLAVLRVSGAAGKSHELGEGDTVVVGEAAYRIAQIQQEPPEVVVARTTPLQPGSEMKVLRPGMPLTDESAPRPLPISAPLPTVAHNDRESPSP